MYPYRDLISFGPSQPVNFTLKLQVFEEDAPEHEREKELALAWSLRTRFVPHFAAGEEDYRLSTCIKAANVNGGKEGADVVWMKAIGQGIIGEPQNGKEPLQAINRVIAYPEAACSTLTTGVCMESIGDTEPGQWKEFDCGSNSKPITYCFNAKRKMLNRSLRSRCHR